MSQTQGTPIRAPGSFSPVVQLGSSTTTAQRRPRVKVDDSEDDDDDKNNCNEDDVRVRPLVINKQRSPRDQQVPPSPRAPQYAPPALPNSSTTSLQNFSRPTPTPLRTDLPPGGGPASAQSPGSASCGRGHGRKNSHTKGSFEPYLPSYSNLGGMANLDRALSASQIAAQAAMQHQSRSVARGSPLDTTSSGSGSSRQQRGPTSPPALNVTEASAPRDGTFGGRGYHNGLLGGHGAAQTAANVVFPKSPSTSPGPAPTEYEMYRTQAEKPKAEKPKVKLFSRPAKIGIGKDKDAKAGAILSPSKVSHAGPLGRANMSTNNLPDSMSSAASMYSMANSSSATIRAEPPEKEKEKEKKHHFLSRQKHKLSSKDDHHLPLSSAASNSKPVDPSAPSSLYNFNLPPSPGPASTSFAKSMSGLDLRHGGRALREKKKEEKSDQLRESELSYQNVNEWPGPSSLGSAGTSYLGSATALSGYPGSIADTQDLSRFGLANMGPDDAWPFLKAKLLIIFEGEDLRLPVEDFNRLVS
jgi:hypothetical protein